MYATVSLCLVLSAAVLSAAAPYYLPGPQQRQLFYPVVPQYSQFPAVASAALPYQQVYYPPQAAVAPVPASLRYPAAAAPLASPFAFPPKQVLYYPGPGGPYILAGDEAANEGYWNSIYNMISNYFTGNNPAESAEKPASETGSAAGGAAEASGEKGSPPKEGEKEKEGEEPKKPEENAKVKGAPQNFVLVGQPQFFGNYGLQRVNPAAVIPSAQNGAVSSYLLLKNFPGVRFAPQLPQAPQAADAELIPGSAALGYQKLLQQASASRQQKDFEDDSSVTVDAVADAALKSADAEAEKPAEAADDAEEKPEEEETGTKE